MRTRNTVMLSAAVLVAVGAGTTGCSAQGERTVPADEFASVIAGALEEEFDLRPEVDCGDDEVAIVDGAEVHCDINTPGFDVVYDSVTTISTDGSDDYRVETQVDDQPKG